MDYPTSGAFPARQAAEDQPLELQRHGLRRHRADAGVEDHADGEIWIETNYRSASCSLDKYNDDFPVADRSSRLVRQRRAATTNCPGNRRWFQLVVRRDAADAVEPDDDPGSRRDPGRGPDAVRRREPEGDLARLRRSGPARPRRTPNTTAPAHDGHRSDARASVAAPDNARSLRAEGEGRRPPLTTPASASASTRPGSRRSPTPIRRRRGRTSTTSPSSLRGRTSSSQRLPASAAPGRRQSTGASTARSSSASRRTWRRRTRRRRDRRHERCDAAARRHAARPDRRHREDRWRRRATTPPADSRWTARRSRSTWPGPSRVKIEAVQVSAHAHAGAEPLHGAAPVPDLGVQQRQRDCSTDAGYTKVYTSGADAFPGDVAAADGAADDPALVQRPGLEGDPPALRRQVDAVHRRAAVPGRAGRGSDATTDCDTNVPATTRGVRSGNRVPGLQQARERPASSRGSGTEWLSAREGPAASRPLSFLRPFEVPRSDRPEPGGSKKREESHEEGPICGRRCGGGCADGRRHGRLGCRLGQPSDTVRRALRAGRLPRP